MFSMMICSIMLFLFSVILFIMSIYNLMVFKVFIIEWVIYSMNSLKFNFFILIDDYSVMLISLVMMISSMVMMYSISYMDMEYFLMKRFFFLTFLFMMSMCFMILSPNMLTILLGWDGLGLISYCLIIFYQNMKSYNSGMLTVILNRIGDASLLMMICLMMINGSWNLMLYKMNWLLAILLIVMSFTKSAQLPFISWLPAAMMAPTPISSLVHSSTLVTAGVYLLIRYSMLFKMECNKYILLVSSFTMLLSGLMANYEMDFKKIIALSTLSQLGFMMSILSMGLNELAYLHMLIHAMFKSLMFLCVGSFIHYMNNIQDLRFYGGMYYIYKFKSLIMMFSLLCLCGFPFLVGFYSKDLIMENFFFEYLNIISMMNLLLGTLFTVSYSIRIILVIFINNSLKLLLFFWKEDNLMNYCMMFMMLLMLHYSKFFLDMKYDNYNVNLSLIYKLMVLKVCFLGIISGIYYYKISFMKKK